MLFATTRLIFGCLIFMIGTLCIRKIHILHRRRWRIATFIGAVVLTSISALIPVENAFITFSSPESAYQYYNSGTAKLFVDGRQTDFVVGEKGDTYVYDILPKTGDGWKIGRGIDIKRVSQTISDDITIYVYQYPNSNDYYLTAMDVSGGPLDITDNRNSTFQCLEKPNDTLNKTFYTYYAYIQNFDEQYTLTVNGSEIDMQG